MESHDNMRTDKQLAGDQAERLAIKVGPAARVVELPGKIDDGILSGGLSTAALRLAFRTARKVGA